MADDGFAAGGARRHRPPPDGRSGSCRHDPVRRQSVDRPVRADRRSLPTEAAAGSAIYAGGVVKRGDIGPAAGMAKDDVLRLALLSSDERSQDPIDLAIITRAREQGISSGTATTSSFTPFDSATKRTEAIVVQDGVSTRIVKGSPQIVGTLVSNGESFMQDVALYGVLLDFYKLAVFRRFHIAG